MEKPKVLYHASPEKDVSEFEPRNESPRYEGEEDFVFATPYKEVAAMFLVPRKIQTEISKYGDVHVVFVNGTEEEFKAQDKGGAIYVLPSETFQTDSEIGMGNTEWASREAVKPISKIVYDTSLEALQKSHVRVYFLDANTFAKIQENPSRGLDFLSNQKV